LNKLEGIGFLSSRRDGKRKYYKANMDFPMYFEFLKIFTKTKVIADLIKDELLDVDGIDLAFFHGSPVIKGEIDDELALCVISNIKKEDVVEIVNRISKIISREITLNVYTSKDLLNKTNKDYYMIKNIFNDHKEFILGDEELYKLQIPK
jgi:glutamate formiminotransferase